MTIQVPLYGHLFFSCSPWWGLGSIIVWNLLWWGGGFPDCILTAPR